MWCFNLLKIAILIVGLVISLSACVVQPVYNIDEVTAREFARIAIASPEDRFGQIISNKLDSLLHVANPPADYKYRLKIIGKYDSRTNLIAAGRTGLDTSAQAISGVIEASATYTLETKTGHRISCDTVYISVPYDRLEQEYANLKAQERACAQAGDDLAEQIYIRLAAFLSQ